MLQKLDRSTQESLILGVGETFFQALEEQGTGIIELALVIRSSEDVERIPKTLSRLDNPSISLNMHSKDLYAEEKEEVGQKDVHLTCCIHFLFTCATV